MEYFERYRAAWSDDSIRLINTPSRRARTLFFYMQEAGYFKTTPLYYTEREHLNSFLIIFTLSGCGELSYQGNSYRLSQNQICFINCMEYHQYRTLPEQTWEFLWIHINGVNTLGLYDECMKNGFQIMNADYPEQYESIIRTIIAINENRTSAVELKTSNLIYTMLTQLLLQTAGQTGPEVILPEYLKEALKYIEQNFKSPITLQDIAEHIHISKYYLCREFKKYIGVTLNEYIINCRLTYAKELLKYTKDSISEITSTCGMNNTSHFINLFKAREFCTPLEYRKEWEGSVF